MTYDAGSLLTSDVLRDTLSAVFAGLFLMAISAVRSHHADARRRHERYDRNFTKLEAPIRASWGVIIELEDSD